MQIITAEVSFSTKGSTDLVDITGKVQELVAQSGLTQGQAVIFTVGSTVGITTVEYEPGLVKTDLPALFDKLAPYDKSYAHDDTWGDDNGAAHLRASLLGSSLTIPFMHGTLAAGTWQQIVVIDFDTRPRQRKVVVQLIGN